MKRITLGRTGLDINKDGFGALPVQRVDMAAAGTILLKALDAGSDYFDTARAYTDSEEKIGRHMAGRRDEFVLATKTGAATVDGFWADLETSLKNLKTDHIDVYQFHNPDFCPRPGDKSGLYDAALEAKKQGKIRFIGITNHRLNVATEAAESGLYDTLQFPFSYLSGEKELLLVKLCAEKNVGFVAMKALSGGLITDVEAAQAFMAEHDNVVPIWGIQREWELDALLAAVKKGAPLDAAQRAKIDADRKELAGEFCRGCGYCMPCPQDIQIFQCARINLMRKRAPETNWISEHWQTEMNKIDSCLHCGKCKSKCPYGLDTPALLEKNLAEYRAYLASRKETA
jgi:aryl-alcohol dehydrogenase-like predicted oxidoreductase